MVGERVLTKCILRDMVYTMANVYIFKVPQGTKQQYDMVVEQLEKEGYGHPPGRLYHFAGPMQGSGWQVTDIWESKELFEEFQKQIKIVLDRLGIPMPDYEVSNADIILDHNVKKSASDK